MNHITIETARGIVKLSSSRIGRDSTIIPTTAAMIANGSEVIIKQAINDVKRPAIEPSHVFCRLKEILCFPKCTPINVEKESPTANTSIAILKTAGPKTSREIKPLKKIVVIPI